MTALPASQRGIALITAILIVSLAVIAATAVLSAGSLAIQRTATLQETEQAWWYATGVEDWVKTILQRDAKDNQYDALNDIWAQPVDGLPVERGFLRGQVIDLQGRFNLNNLGAANQPDFESAKALFMRLFDALKLEPALARSIAESIRDWIDTDQEPTPYDGAEDTEYLQAKPPYRTPNRLMVSVSELMAVKGVTPEIYAALLPYVTALPRTDTRINVNTAPEPVLVALAGQPSAELAEFVRERVKEPAKTLAEFNQEGVIGGKGAAGGSTYDVSSKYFQLRGEATIGNSRVAIYSLYYRPPQGAPQVLSRSTDSE